ncbi:MAG: B12-binding domain-containing radical SAM protein [Thermoplasmata archaeon]|nr:B12-binding domain-containing radical SAM protein [Thermoplasmata archaeon]
MCASKSIVLTADRTLMSSYNGSQFIGFAACFPKVLPRWLYSQLFCPPQASMDSDGIAAPAGLRRIESALVHSGTPKDDVAVVHPSMIDRVVDENTRVIGISTSDPLGRGPASSTFSSLIDREPYTAHFFRELMDSRAVRSRNTRVIVGGAGAWQLADVDVMKVFGIDCVVKGEGELVTPPLFKDALAGRPLPLAVSGGPVPVDGIPEVMGPTVNGTVEISRGCGRGCEFCNPNMRRVRHVSLERILSEVRTNLAYSSKVTLHAEDVLRYRAKGMIPDEAEVTRLFEETARLTSDLGMSHIALASALSKPSLIQRLSEVFDGAKKGSVVYAQTGIETGSPRLVKNHMKGKAKPFAPEKWPEVVRESFALLSDHHWVVCGTLVMGMPGETREDVEKTLDLVRDLKSMKSLIVPLFFVPLGEMKGDEFFRPDAMLPEHWMLFAECVDHDFRWAQELMDDLFRQNRLSVAKSGLFRLAAWYMQRRLRPYLEMMHEGKNPLKHAEGVRDANHAESRRKGAEA